MDKVIELGKTKKAGTILLALVLALGVVPISPLVPSTAEAAQTSGGDIFEELGIDTNARPDGYIEGDENPYGRNTTLVNPISELYIGKRSKSESSETGGDESGSSETGGDESGGDEPGGDESGDETGAHYGHGSFSGTMAEFFKEESNKISLSFDLAKADAVKTAPGNFTGDGRKSMFVAVSANIEENGGVYLSINNPDLSASEGKGHSSGKKIYDGSLGNEYEREYYLSKKRMENGKEIENEYYNPDLILNYLEVATGDFDGNGYDEIAVYVPDPARPRVEIYQLQQSSTDESWEIENWKLIFTHNLLDYEDEATKVRFAPSIVKLLSADLNHDGVDDLLVGAGACTYDITYNTKHSSSTALFKTGTAEVLWGSKQGNALVKRHDVLADMPTLNSNFFSPNEIRKLSPRFDFAYGDMAGDGQDSLIIATNTTIAMTRFDNATGKFVLEAANNLWNDLNQSSVVIHSDAVIMRRGKDTPQLIWMNQAFVFGGHGFAPDESSSPFVPRYDSGWEQRDETDKDLWHRTLHNSTLYNVSVADLNGDGFDEVCAMVNYTSHEERKYRTAPFEEAPDSGKIGTLLFQKNACVYNSRSIDVYSKGALVYREEASTKGYYALPDTDHDTMTMKYVGRSFQYSDPELLTVIAAPPTFGDLETVRGDDNTGGDEYIDNSETSFASHKGTGQGDSDTVTLAAGAYVSYEQEITVPIVAQTVAKFEMEFEYKHEWTWDYERMSTETHTVEYTTNGFQDSVALYSIPTDHFIYEIAMDDGKGNLTTSTISVSIPYQAVVKVMAVDEYDEIAEGSGGALPVVRGDILTHTLGDPATYPSAAVGTNPLVYNGNWAGVGFGFGEITQSIALESEYSEAFSHTDSIDFKFGGGPGSLVIGVVGGASWQRTDVEVDLSGGTASGTIANMPEEARPYGYNYAWKLLWTNAEHGDSTIPVVTYLVRDVTAPPRMPQNFTADYAQITSNSIPLTWEYDDDNILGFQIWRMNKTPGMEGKFESIPHGYVPSVRGQKNYTFTDTGLAAATEYTYNIQVMRSKVPQGSVPSGAISAWTHAAVGAPTVLLSSYKIKTYTDKAVKITSSLRNEPVGAVVAGYQWEKIVGGKWTALPNVTTEALSISAPKLATSGSYRLAVSMIMNNQTVVGYSSPASVEVDKRTVSVTVAATENAASKTLNFSSILTNNFTDSVAVPDGKVTFEVQKMDAETGIFGETTNYTVDVVRGIEKGTAEYTLKNAGEGTYKVRARYAGNGFFDSALSDEMIHIVGDVSETMYYIELPRNILYTYTPFEARVYKAKKTEGRVEVEEVFYTGGTEGERISASQAYYSKGKDAYLADNASSYHEGRAVITSKIVGKDHYDDIKRKSYVEVTVIAEDGSEKTIQSPHYVVEKLPINISLPSKTVVQDEAVLPTTGDIVFDYPTGDDSFSPIDWSNYLEKDFEVTCYNNVNQGISFDSSTPPGVYTIKPAYKGGNYGLLFNSVGATYVVTNATYGVGATAKLLNGVTAGSVSVTSPLDNDNVNWTTKYPYGTEIVFTATPYARYMVDYWMINGVKYSGDTMKDRNVYTHHMRAEAVSAEVYFKTKETKLTFEARPAEGGTVEMLNNPNFVSGGVMYEQSPLSFKAIPEPRYEFVEWQVLTPTGWSYPEGEKDTDGRHTLSTTMPDTDMGIRALFERQTYTITLGENLTASYMHDHDNNVATPEREEWITSGDKVMGGKTLTVRPKPGYAVDSSTWKIDPVTESGISADQAYTYVVARDVSITAEAAVQSYEVQLEVLYPPGFSAPEASPVTLMGPDGSIDLQEGKATVQGGTSLIVAADQPSNALVFDAFTITGSEHEIQGGTATISALADDLTIKVTYKENNHYLLKTEDPPEGAILATLNGEPVTVDAAGCKVYQGDLVAVSAIPTDANTHAIGFWVVNGQRSGVAGPETREFEVEGALTIGHEFAQANPVTVSWNNDTSPMTEVRRASNGAEIVSGEVVSAGTNVILQATLQADEAIESWIVNDQVFSVGEKTYTANPLRITVETDTVVSYTTKEAVFHTLTLTNGAGGSASISFDREVDDPHEGIYSIPDGTEATLTLVPAAGHTPIVPDFCGEARNVRGTFVYDFVVSSETELDITYRYEAPSFALSLNQSLGGAIQVVGGVSTAMAGTSVELENAPESGYVFDSWTVVDGEGKTIKVMGNQFTMPASTVTVTATFSKAAYSLTYDTTGGGVVTGSAGASFGDTITLVVKPEDGYELDTLIAKKADSEDIALDANHTFIMPASDVTVLATFKPARLAYVDAKLSSLVAVFDKSPANAAYKDASVTLDPGNYLFSNIVHDGKILKEGKHYTKDGFVFTFSKEYLSHLEVGVQAFTFDMNGGEDPVLMVLVSSSTLFDREWVRLAGKTRYDTMTEIVYKGFMQAETVIVATGENFPDALAASAYAGLSESPILITAKNALSPQTASAIMRLKASKVYVVGGVDAVSQAVENSLRGLPLVKNVERIGGATRYDTALQLYYQGEGAWGKTAIVATGEVFADSLSFSPYSYAEKAPVFLSNPKTGLNAASLTAIKNGGFTRILIAGGTDAVPATVDKQLKGLGSGLTYERLFGAHRYETSARIAQWSVENSSKLDYDDIVVTIGSNFPDALVGGPLAGGRLGSILLLVDDTGAGAHGLTAVIEKNAPQIYQGYYLGSTSVISDAFAARIRAASL